MSQIQFSNSFFSITSNSTHHSQHMFQQRQQLRNGCACIACRMNYPLGKQSKAARIRPSRKLLDDAISCDHWANRDLALEKETDVREYLQKSHQEYPTGEWLLLSLFYYRIIEFKYGLGVQLDFRFAEYDKDEHKRRLTADFNIQLWTNFFRLVLLFFPILGEIISIFLIFVSWLQFGTIKFNKKNTTLSTKCWFIHWKYSKSLFLNQILSYWWNTTRFVGEEFYVFWLNIHVYS